ESRKPTYVEFILLKILISYGDKDQILQRVIEGELGIKNSSLFQRALTDLINFDIVKVKKNISEQDFNAILNIKISELKVSTNIERKFVSGDFMMSNIIKYIELKYVYDPLTKKTEIIKKID